MKNTHHLTNERLRNMFENQFELVNYAIKLAEHFIKSGREPFIHHETQNLSSHILEVIESGKDKFKNLPNEAALIAEVEAAILNNHAEEEVVGVVEIDDEEDSEEKTETVEAM